MVSRTAIAMVLFGLAAQPALADAIDGEWCAPDGRRLSIQGPHVTTPGGARITGDYRRHFFRYVVPKPEPGAGATVEMALRSEEEVLVKPAPNAQVEAWYRCPYTT